MEFHDFIDKKKELYNFLLAFIENVDDEIFHFQNLTRYLETQRFDKNHEEFKSFLRLLLKISKNQHRTPDFFNKIEKILQFFEAEIKQTFSNIEIFDLFKNSKRILLFLFQNNIITHDESLNDFLKNNCIYSKYKTYRFYFFPEIKSSFKDPNIKSIERELEEIDSDIFLNFEENRQKGENESYICSLIQKDLVDDFISYVIQTNLPLSSTIKPSIFETNSFLLKNKETSLIEYSAFYGSIQIFQYLRLNNIELKPSLWLYAIHGRNADIIHLLEENLIVPEDKSYHKCLEESIKCHHNEIANYIINNFIDLNDDENYDNNALSYSFHYYNYSFFPTDFNNKFIFYYACQYNYIKIVKLLLSNKKDLNLNMTIILI
ncbi:hypothetical protein M9Y10_043020 [Tritrichomonas musculus]|uniref:DUF3447 domain-containing protein n=1 Tax=Tritrichomonas musculus TaxID=1915356 RepID=A0ABR2JZ64_9EUKA